MSPYSVSMPPVSNGMHCASGCAPPNLPHADRNFAQSYFTADFGGKKEDLLTKKDKEKMYKKEGRLRYSGKVDICKASFVPYNNTKRHHSTHLSILKKLQIGDHALPQEGFGLSTPRGAERGGGNAQQHGTTAARIKCEV
jgi:hypothetical protein